MAGVCSGSGPCDTSPTGHGGDNWVTRAGGLPAWARAIVNALKRNGHSESQAIQIMWGTVRNWARGQGDVKPETRAKAAALVARLDAMRGASHSLTADPSDALDLAIPVASTTDGAQITVSVGQHMAALRKLAAAHKRAGPSQRPKLRAAMATHAKAIQKARKS